MIEKVYDDIVTGDYSDVIHNIKKQYLKVTPQILLFLFCLKRVQIYF